MIYEKPYPQKKFMRQMCNLAAGIGLSGVDPAVMVRRSSPRQKPIVHKTGNKQDSPAEVQRRQERFQQFFNIDCVKLSYFPQPEMSAAKTDTLLIFKIFNEPNKLLIPNT